MGRGFSEILSGELQGSAQRYVNPMALAAFLDARSAAACARPGISTEQTEALVAGANEIVYGEFSVVARHCCAPPLPRKNRSPARWCGSLRPAARSAKASSRWPMRWPASWARRIPSAPPTRKPCALMCGSRSTRSGRCLTEFRASHCGRSEFRARLCLWLDTALGQRNRAEADRDRATGARASADHLPAVDRAALDLGAAALSGDYPAQVEALARTGPSRSGAIPITIARWPKR